MDNKGQSALEYLMTYGWALVVIAIVIAALVFLLGQSTNASNCSMSPAAGAIGYVDHAIAADGTLSIVLRNDSGKTITTVGYVYGGDFTAAADMGNGPFNSAEEFTVTAASGVTSGSTYQGTMDINYQRSGITHVATASCTGQAA